MNRRLDTLSLAAAAFVAANVLHSSTTCARAPAISRPRCSRAAPCSRSSPSSPSCSRCAATRARALWAAVVGTWSALGVIASHVAPHWSALSDSYFEIHADALSWVVMLAEVAAAAYLGLVGFRELRRPAGGSRRRPRAARQSAA